MSDGKLSMGAGAKAAAKVGAGATPKVSAATQAGSKPPRELRRHRKLSFGRLTWVGAVTGLIAFFLYYALRTFANAGSSDGTQHLLIAMSVYLVVAFVGCCAFLIVSYRSSTFAEVSENRWYAPVKMGYSPFKMITGSLLRNVGYIAWSYFVGAVLLIALSCVSGSQWSPTAAILSLLDGVILLAGLVVFSLALSLYARKQQRGRWSIVLVALVLWVLRISTGFAGVMVSDSLQGGFGQALSALWATNYPLYGIIALVLGVVLCLVKARSVATTTNFTFYSRDMDFADDETIVFSSDGKEFEPVQDEYLDMPNVRKARVWVNILLVTLVVLFVAVDAVAFGVSVSRTPGYVTMLGYIPTIEDGDSMEPIMGDGDFAVYKAVDPSTLQTDDVIIYLTDDGDSAIKRVAATSGDTLTINVVNAAESSDLSQRETIDASQAYGVLVFSNAFLGGIIGFAASSLGSVVCLMVPLLILLFYQRIEHALIPSVPGAGAAPRKKQQH